MRITTTEHDGKVTAKGGGKQRTIPMTENRSKSHAHAALALITVLQQTGVLGTDVEAVDCEVDSTLSRSVFTIS